MSTVSLASISSMSHRPVAAQERYRESEVFVAVGKLNSIGKIYEQAGRLLADKLGSLEIIANEFRHFSAWHEATGGEIRIHLVATWILRNIPKEDQAICCGVFFEDAPTAKFAETLIQYKELPVPLDRELRYDGSTNAWIWATEC